MSVEFIEKALPTTAYFFLISLSLTDLLQSLVIWPLLALYNQVNHLKYNPRMQD